MKTLIVGFDSLDPVVFDRLASAGRLPHLTALARTGSYAPLAVSNPPQTEVSWTSIATGLNPGGHGIFDFVHRNPDTYAPYVSLLPTASGLGGHTFAPPSTTPTLFDTAARDGYPATALWWPAAFPARPARPVRTIPGLGTPDIHGRLGVGTLFTTSPGTVDERAKTAVQPLEATATGALAGRLAGPGDAAARPSVPFTLELSGDGGRLAIGRQVMDLPRGTWTPIIEVVFKIRFGVKVRVLTQAIVSRVQPDVRIYFLPLQLHPLHAPWPYGAPRGFLKDTWRRAGPFLTLGWPQDTTALEDGCIDDAQFLSLCESIDAQRERVLAHQLERFDEGVLGIVFDSLDRVQHMFTVRSPDTVHRWYERCDAAVGRIVQRLSARGGAPSQLLVLSDHGFAPFRYKVHLNRWLVEGGYMARREASSEAGLGGVDWERTSAYAVGLNGVYLNRRGREARGIVSDAEADATLDRLKASLLAWPGPDGSTVVERAWTNREAFEGAHASAGPDLVVGYRPGYRASAETGLGQIGARTIEDNHDHWEADHCVNVEAVPGVIFSNRRDVAERPSYRDVPVLVTGRMPDGGGGPAPPAQDEDEAVVTERLKGLGYL